METAGWHGHSMTQTRKSRGKKNILNLFLTLKSSWSYENIVVVVGETESSQTHSHLFVIPQQLRCSSEWKHSPHSLLCCEFYQYNWVGVQAAPLN